MGEDQFAFVLVAVKGESVLVRGDLTFYETVEISQVNFAASSVNRVSDRVVVFGTHGGVKRSEVVVKDVFEFTVTVDVATTSKVRFAKLGVKLSVDFVNESSRFFLNVPPVVVSEEKSLC